MSTKVSRAQVLADLRRVAEELGHPPTTGEYREHGEYSVPTVGRHFDGSFTAARAEACDTTDGRRAEIPRENLLADVERVAEIVGGEPPRTAYQEHGEYGLSTIEYRFDSWIDAKKEAGVYDGLDAGATREELLADLRRVDEEIDGAVSQVAYNEHGEWSVKPIKSRFETFEQACQEAGVTRPNKGPQTAPTEALIEDIRQVADELGHAPSRREYHEHGQFSRQMAISRVSSWPEAVRRAGYEPREAGGQPGEMNANWEGGYGEYYGQNWHEQRRKARERDGHECVACGMTEQEHMSQFGWELEVHHITPVRTFDEPENANELANLVTLCRTHHREYEQLPAERAKELLD